MKLPLRPGPAVTSYRPGSTSVPPMKVPESSVTAAPLTCLVGAGVVVVGVVVVGVDVPDRTGLFVVFSGAAPPDGGGWVAVDAVTGGDFVVGAPVVGVVTAASGLVLLTVLACVSGVCDPLGGEGEVEDDEIPDDGIMGTPEGRAVAPNGLNGVVNPLATAVGPDEDPGPSATDTTIATMPRTEAPPIAFCRRRTFI